MISYVCDRVKVYARGLPVHPAASVPGVRCPCHHPSDGKPVRPRPGPFRILGSGNGSPGSARPRDHPQGVPEIVPQHAFHDDLRSRPRYGSRPRPGAPTAFPSGRARARAMTDGRPPLKTGACGVVSLRRHCPDQVPGVAFSLCAARPLSLPVATSVTRRLVRSSSLDHLADDTHAAQCHERAPRAGSPGLHGRTSCLRRKPGQRSGAPYPVPLRGVPGRLPRPRPAPHSPVQRRKPAASRDGGVHASKVPVPQDHSLAAATSGLPPRIDGSLSRIRFSTGLERMLWDDLRTARRWSRVRSRCRETCSRSKVAERRLADAEPADRRSEREYHPSAAPGRAPSCATSQ